MPKSAHRNEKPLIETRFPLIELLKALIELPKPLIEFGTSKIRTVLGTNQHTPVYFTQFRLMHPVKGNVNKKEGLKGFIFENPRRLFDE